MEEEFSCYYTNCNKKYKSKYNLTRHINSMHLGIKNFICSLCQKSFVSKQTLLEHEFLHTGEKPYKCSYPNCGELFRQSSQLSLHKKSHRVHREVNQKDVGILNLTKFWKDYTTPNTIQPQQCGEDVKLPNLDEARKIKDPSFKLPIIKDLLEI
jgi:uncharacterized Zn-finger protein